MSDHPQGVDRDELPTGAYQPEEPASELVRVLDQYLADLQAGRAPERAQLLAAHPALASQLERCLAGIEFIHHAAQPTPTAPAQLGDFRILREIGRGGMGVVYEAEQLSLHRQVALKVLRFGAVADAEVMRRFQREAETVARLHHTNIVPIFAVGCEQGVHYYAMQYIEGRSLAAVLEASQAQETPLDPREVARWGLQAAEALAHAHARGVIHRDIKPSNLLLDPEGVIWLTDFGLAKRADEVVLTATGVLLGTPRYMSPEQAAAVKQPVDHRTDIYSLGATLYELATGKPVFDADTPHGVITQILNAEPVAPRRLQANLPRDLETIILKCLAKEPARRYATAQALADDLRDFLHGRTIKARRPGLVERSVRWVKKQRRSVNVAAAAAVLSALLVIGTAMAWNWYADWQLVHLSLTTEGPHLKAEVWDEARKSVVARFTVPTQEAQRLPPGDYQVRLERDGQLSETYQLFAGPHEQFSGQVGLIDRQLWELPVGPGETFHLVNRDDRAGKPDLILLSDKELRCLDGTSGKMVWSRDLAKLIPESLIPYPELKIVPASHLLQPGSSFFQELPGLVQPLRDLDEDGVGDLVWASRTSPSLLAISGKTGQALWWYSARPTLPPGVEEHQVQSRSYYNGLAVVVGRPVAANLDGQPLYVAAFDSRGEDVVLKQPGARIARAKPQRWVEAVWGKTGQPLWRHDLGEPVYSGLDFSCVATIARIGGRQTVVLLSDTRLIGLDLRTGNEAWPSFDLGFPPLGTPQFVDLEGDGQVNALVLEKRQGNERVVEVLSLAPRQPVWQTSAKQHPNQDWRRPYQTPQVEVLQQGGKPEVLTLYREPQRGEGGGEAVIEVRAGRSGEVRWSRRLGPGWEKASAADAAGRFLVGPDLDGDGYREVFVASVVRWLDKASPNAYLFVDVLSGKDGHPLCWSRTEWDLPGDNSAIRPLRWWQPGPDGWPLLVVPVLPTSGVPERGRTYVFASGTGRLEFTIPQSGEPHVADFNADGLPDLLLSPPPDWQGRSNGGTLRVLRGAPPEAWRLLASSWKPAQDFDGDGVADLFSSLHYSRRTTVTSGRDGHRLWQVDVGHGEIAVTPIPDNDLDGDGVADALLAEQKGDNFQGLSLHAYSGRTGHRLWTAEITVGPKRRTVIYNERLPYLRCHDLTGQGRPDVIWGYVVESASTPNIYQLWLARVSGRDGTVIWNQPLHDPGNLFLPTSPELRPAMVDVDGDGVVDVVLWVPVGGDQGDGQHCAWELRAFSGRDGRLLWRRPLIPSNQLGPRVASSSWQRPSVRPVTSNGVPEILVTVYGERKGDWKQSLEVTALSARNGETKWSWRGDDGSRIDFASNWEITTPQVVKLENGSALCVSIHDENLRTKQGPKTGQRIGSASQLVLLDAGRGQVLQRRDVQPKSDRVLFWVRDLDGNGRDEVVFIDRGKVWATESGVEKEKWSWSLPTDQESEILEILPAGKDYPATVVVTVGDAIYGLAGPTGLPRWRCDTGPFGGVPRLLASTRSQGLPQVVFPGASATVIGRMALPAGPDGRYRLPTPAPRAYGPLPEDPRLTRPLPWAVSAWYDRRVWLAHWTAVIGLFGGAILPGWLLRGAIRRRSWTFGLLSVVVLGTTLGGIYFLFGGLALVGALLYGLVFGLPWFVLLRLLVGWVVRRRWRYLGYLLLGLLVVTLTYAGLAWQSDARHLEPAEYYSWNDWYAVFLPGAYFTGVLILAGFTLAAIGRLLWRRVRRVFPQPKPA